MSEELKSTDASNKNRCPICWKPYYDDHQSTIIPDLCQGHEEKGTSFNEYGNLKRQRAVKDVTYCPADFSDGRNDGKCIGE